MCTPSAGGRTCTCNNGFVGDGITCLKADGQTCSGGPECNSGQCVLNTCCSGANCPECLNDAGCTVATRPLCIASKCAPCNSSAACRVKNGATPTCATTGPSIGACVECVVHGDCTVANRSICINYACVSCLDAGGAGPNANCQLRDPNREQCDGADTHGAYGTCTECRNQQECNATRAFCNHTTGNCDPCNLATGTYNPNSACGTASTGNPKKNYCHLASGMCVICLSGNRCPTLAPVNDAGGTRDAEGICQSNNMTCTPITCTSDAQCTGPQYQCEVGYCLEPA
jgi:hypothetical protein